MRSRTKRALMALSGAAIVSIAFASVREARRVPTVASAEPSAAREEARYVGSAACASCHPQEHRAWTGSHHDRAMAEPSPRSVLAPFAGEEAVLGRGRRAKALRFEREGRRYVVRSSTGRESGPRQEVAFTIGVAPLQQLLVLGEHGGYRALPVAWSARRPRDRGLGWHPLLDAREPATPSSRGNSECVECHATVLERRYDEASDELAIRFAAIDVGCESCHGAASRHVAWAEHRSRDLGIENALRSDHVWSPDPSTGSARPHARPATAEVETCAPCHSLREPIAKPPRAGTPFLDAFRPSLLTSPGYYPDGRIRGEAYEWGSFVQSGMFHAGVACSDCHDPHSATLRASGDALCARCHAETKFGSAEHRARGPAGTDSTCVGCHMSSRTYAGIDARHDHSMRARRGETDTAEARPDVLLEWVADRSRPAIVRATALTRLSRLPTQQLREAVDLGAHDGEELVRMASAMAAASLPREHRYALVGPLLGDTRLAVRVEAARALVDAPREELDSARLRTLDAAIEELLASERVRADRPDAWVRIAEVERARGRRDAAEAAYREALRRGPGLPSTYLSLVELARARGDERATEAYLREALERTPRDTDVLHAFGLLRLRQGRAREALPFLREASDRRPSEPHFAYVYALALDRSGDRRAAVARLDAALARSPRDAELLSAWQRLTRR